MGVQRWVLSADIPIRWLVVTMAEKILVVDDEYLVLNMLVETLKSKGYETFCTSDGFKAMQMMPELDGHMFTRYVRRVSDIP